MEVKNFNLFVVKPLAKTKPKTNPKPQPLPKPKTKFEARGLSLENEKNYIIFMLKVLLTLVGNSLTMTITIPLDITKI